MLTTEQIKNLKPGDKLVVQGEFCKAHNNGDILVSLSAKQWERAVHELLFLDPSCVSLPTEIGNSQSKHDPCRPFKKGDIVRLKEWNGRCPEMYSGTNSWFNHPPRCKNGNLEVREDEKNSRVEIGIIGADCAHAAAAPAYLELVTPVEELEPYSVVDAHTHCDVADKDMKIVVTYSKLYHPNAKAAAEAECKRLNEEYRKEQNL